MADWVCEVCLVPNDNDTAACCCCTTPRPKSANPPTDPVLSQETTELSEAVENGGTEAEVKEERKKQTRARRSRNEPPRARRYFNPARLPRTTVFVVGSSEVDQLPRQMCDVRRTSKSKEVESLFECSRPTPIVDGIQGTVAAVACGSLHTALLMRRGHVYTFGCNDMGALGRDVAEAEKHEVPECNPYIVRMRNVVTRVSCGDNHTLFLTSNGAVFFAGAFRDTAGNIGIPDFSDLEKLTNAGQVKTPVALPCGEEGSTPIKDICSGENHCLLLPAGGAGVYVLGSNEFGQLMLPEGYKPVVPTEEDPDLSVEGTAKLALTWPQFLTLSGMGLEAPTDGHRVKRRKYGDEFIERIFAGYCTSFVETGVGHRIYGAGRNAQGELGCGSDDLFVRQPRELTALRDLRIRKIVGGQYFSVALTAGGKLFTWGNSCYTGHGGDDDFAKQTKPTRLTFFKANVQDVFVGADATFALTIRGRLFAWGSAQNYILGNGQDYSFQKTPMVVPVRYFRGFRVVGGMGGSQHTVFLCKRLT
ncbi:regulator of chromosome condensation RCC1 [Babesia caballi]|uniref:Regulator of chromosome condensation RCC1 n=1 Tax=Babesia caballi TaxID=5871 RepID=A0AAV4LQR2_BABCB|nr:regulator of chromosome condensation RCC1 [Babesia caballi]